MLKIKTRKIERIKMVIQRLEICIGMVKLAFEFVAVFVKAVGSVISAEEEERNYVAQTPYIGLLP
uniref:Uncharacterized protein n=1 Tax=Solanum lycopersicum TaxID=4081 RepID=A0A3Q7ET07_SOLLC